jgi:hypothetical protein
MRRVFDWPPEACCRAEFLKRALLVFITFSVCACSDASRSAEFVQAKRVDASDLSMAVTSAVALLDKNGAPVLVRDENASRRAAHLEMDSNQAVLLATRWLRKFGKFQATLFSQESGVRIDVADLVPCRTARYAVNAYLPAGSEGASALDRARFGAWWIVPICHGSSTRAVVTVSAQADKEAIPANADGDWGRLRMGDFQWSGVSERDGLWLVNDPEAAVMFAARATGERVAASPRLIVLPGWTAYRTFWQIQLERPVLVERVGLNAPERHSVVYVGGIESDRLVETGAMLFARVFHESKPPIGRRRRLPTPSAEFARDTSLPVQLERVTAVRKDTSKP